MRRLRNMKTQKHAQTEKHDNKVVGRQVDKPEMGIEKHDKS